MTLEELVDHANGNLGLKVTVSKHDKNQLSSHGTVPVQSCYIGFDWEHGQLVLEPTIKLTTDPEEVETNTRKKYIELYESKVQIMAILSKMSKLIQNLPNSTEKTQLETLLKETLTH